MIVYNRKDAPIFICPKWLPDPAGGPAISEITYCVAPGEGIELAALGLEPLPLHNASRDLFNACRRALREMKDGELTVGLEEDLEAAILKAEGGK